MWQVLAELANEDLLSIVSLYRLPVELHGHESAEGVNIIYENINIITNSNLENSALPVIGSD